MIIKDSGSAVKNQRVHNKPREIVSPFAQDPNEPEKIAVWGDLAEIDNEASSDTESLWAYWAEMVKPYLQLGFKGFQCDAAYKIPAELWRYLVEKAVLLTPTRWSDVMICIGRGYPTCVYLVYIIIRKASLTNMANENRRLHSKYPLTR